MKIKVALVSAGLGNVSRGFETSAATWYEELKNSPELDLKLFSGGNYPESIRVWNLSRNGFVCSILRKLKIIKDGCRLEQISFAFGFIFHIIRHKPNVIWLQEISLAQWILKFRGWFGFQYKIVFCDGAPVGHRKAIAFDHIVFLHEYARQDALRDGIPSIMLSTIPHISILPKAYTEKSAAKKHFEIPENNFIILCVAAWNKHHKRIHYLIEETATWFHSEEKPVTLFLCGQAEKETLALKALAEELQIPTIWRTLSTQELAIAYDSADVFVLPSLSEGLGAVLIEAGFHNLPVICHQHDAAKFIFGTDYIGLTDLSITGNLAHKIQEYQFIDLQILGTETGNVVKKMFDPTILRDQFTGMIKAVYHS